MLVNHLASLGFDVSDALVERAKKSCQTSVGQSPSNKTKAQQQRAERKKLTSHQAALKNMATPDGADWVPRKYHTINDLSLNLLMVECLVVVEPGSLSCANLRTMKTSRGSNACLKANVLMVVEFVTGCPPSWEFLAEMRH